ncbi:Ni-sirohydrochlorin a,c-diamide reductive cyclase catalytic subunit [Methanonatronarchaeum sp. AMET-Sl]|uniref:Ni-sirohydrochlorin a,c-diamide reductive cyclase catalytic subunit n=1 Tax=Methanonatronarchaeum sp. AMET-Sl TaxID=3037654 RepID=UPI00244DDCA1|nr:Ni-sirohydrochlorin a,c-diamide reductive cyclase catalytic subunit [Methanonatronarchaeum sp. AMET-Sl]WGI16871.1 Ni-sirohydrochlorin a,c-diamide reductive cyclase catalytic subunit [Methanonatronarchaeum sp. AMET-Sl]
MKSSVFESKEILHPRPSSIVAAMYTMRDLGVDLIVMHGPPGCSFKHGRLLEEDGVVVLTSAMGEDNFVFGGEEVLVRALERGIERFSPELVGVVGTCASMIIGEELGSAVGRVDSDVPIVSVDVHSGYRDNTVGVTMTLDRACEVGLVSEEEVSRQKEMLEKASLVEKRLGSANDEYIPPMEGDLKVRVAKEIKSLIESGGKGVVVLNAKKETSYIFSDIMHAINQASELNQEFELVNVANLVSERGLPRVRENAETVDRQLKERGVDIDFYSGSLDEYPVAGDRAREWIMENHPDYDFLVLLGVPHAIEITEGKIISVTNGPRGVVPMKKELNHDWVVVEKDLHTRCMGVRDIKKSITGETLRELI